MYKSDARFQLQERMPISEDQKKDSPVADFKISVESKEMKGLKKPVYVKVNVIEMNGTSDQVCEKEF